MKKTTIYLFLMLCSLFAQAQYDTTQTIDYSIYAPSKDSFFLVETVTGAVTKDVKRPPKSETSILFRSEAQLLDYVQYLRNQAETAKKQSEDVVTEATAAAKKTVEDARAKSKQLKDVAPRLEYAASKIEAVARANRDVFAGKPSKDKPKKKKRQ